MIFKKKRQITLSIGFFLIITTILGTVINSDSKEIFEYSAVITDDNMSELGEPSTSAFWTNFSFIHINNNWTIAKALGWISGNGVSGDPYILENMTIDATTSITNHGIWIQNAEASNEKFIIRNCTITNWGSGVLEAGILIQNSDDGLIYNNDLQNSDNGVGVLLDNDCSNNIVINNTITDVYSGIRVRISSDLNFVLNNSVTSSNQGTVIDSGCDNTTISDNFLFVYRGVTISTAYDTKIINNTIDSPPVGGNPNGIMQYLGGRTIIENNTIINVGENGIYLYGDGNDHNIIRNNTIINSDMDGIYLDSSDNNEVADNYIYNVITDPSPEQDCGIRLSDTSSFNTIVNNTILNNLDNGIYILDDCNNNTITHNIAGNLATLNQDIGIKIENSCNNTISANNVSYNTEHGIYLDNSNNTRISANNEVSFNGINGIKLQDAHSNYIIDNLDSITNNTECGIFLNYSDSNVIIDNKIINSSIGICLNDSDDNYVYNNEISNWTIIDVQDNGNRNILSEPSDPEDPGDPDDGGSVPGDDDNPGIVIGITVAIIAGVIAAVGVLYWKKDELFNR